SLILPSAHPSPLTSFPTRRSSDLSSGLIPLTRSVYSVTVVAYLSSEARLVVVAGRVEWVLLAYRVPREPSSPRIAIWRRLRRLRSEEHTSELQSLRHLVCRLLLEK